MGGAGGGGPIGLGGGVGSLGWPKCSGGYIGDSSGVGGLLVAVVVVVSTVVIVRDCRFVRGRGTLCWNGGVALLLRCVSIIARIARICGGVILF